MYDIVVCELVCNSTFVPAFVRRLHSRNGIRSHRLGERGGTPSTGEKAESSGAFGGWNDLDRMVKWREGGGETKAVFCDFAMRGGCDGLRGSKQHEAMCRISFFDRFQKFSLPR